MTEVRSLMRSMLRAARQFQDYNLRKYAERRTILGFRENVSASSSDIPALVTEARKALAMMKRQSSISEMFQSGRSVMSSPKN